MNISRRAQSAIGVLQVGQQTVLALTNPGTHLVVSRIACDMYQVMYSGLSGKLANTRLTYTYPQAVAEAIEFMQFDVEVNAE